MNAKILVLCSLALAMTACEPITGSIQFFKSITVQSQQTGNCGYGELDPCLPTTATIPAGDAQFSLVFRNRQAMTLTVKTKSQQISTEIMLPSEKSIPANGRVSFTAQEIAQPFDLQVDMQTVVTDSPEMHGYEQCTVTIREEVCRRDRDNRRHCGIEYVEYRGTRDVSYFHRTTDEDLSGQLTTPGHSNDLIAKMVGSRSETKKIYTYQGQCRLY